MDAKLTLSANQRFNPLAKKITTQSIESVILSLMLFSVVATGLYYCFGQSKTLLIEPERFPFSVIADGDYSALGLSKAHFSERHAIDCQLQENTAVNPYCGININLEQQLDQGLDLSMYHSLHLDVDLLTTPHGTDAPIRVYLRNHNPAYSLSGNNFTRKYIGLSYHPNSGQGRMTLPLQTFQVMTWWSEQMDLGLEFYGTEFDNVTAIELAFVHRQQSGRYQMRINSAELEGYYIYPQHFYFGLVSLWFVVLGTVVGVEYLQARRNSEKFRRKLEEVETANRALSERAQCAEYDELTGILNRHGAKQWIKQYSQRIELQHCAIIYIDLDHFKRVNDKFGHAMGDKVLKTFAAELHTQVPPHSFAARWGGEEFIIFCPNFKSEKAEQLATALLEHIHSCKWPHQQEQTCSMGLAAGPLSQIEQTMSQADDMLYKAKQSGRNQLQVYNQSQ